MFREELHQLQRYPNAQLRLIDMVDHMDRKGQGADLQVHYSRRRDGSVDADVQIIDNNHGPQRPFHGGQDNHYRPPQPYGYNRQDSYYGNNQYQPYYGNRQDSSYYPNQYAHNNQDYSYRPNNQYSYNNRPENSHSSYPRGNDVARPGELTTGTMYALQRAQADARAHGVNIEITSAGRTYQEQARLYSQLHGRSPVAAPGSSSHEKGLAIDVKNYSQAEPYLVANGFTHGDGSGPIAGDPWHFKYLG
jgi:hypothetical protein